MYLINRRNAIYVLKVDFSRGWRLSEQAYATLTSLESNQIIVKNWRGTEVDFEQELDPGSYEIKITDIKVPETPIIGQVNFVLKAQNRICEKSEPDDFFTTCHKQNYKVSELNALFIADRPEPENLNIDHLINKYAPILYFDGGRICDDSDDERYTVPLDVQYTWGKNPPLVKGQPLITGNINQTFKVHNQDYETKPNDNKVALYQDKTKGAIYAAVVEDKEKKQIAINYYFHYPISNWKEYNGHNNHVGDWEGITVFLDKNDLKPKRVAFSQHIAVAGFKGGYTVPWDLADKEGNQPKVYVGLGGHASFPFAGMTEWPSIEGEDVRNWLAENVELHKGDHRLGRFNPRDNSQGRDKGQVRYLKRAGKLSLKDPDNWLLYPGGWGQDIEYPEQWKESGGPPPRGPIFQDVDVKNFREISGVGDRWLDPWKWSEDFKTLQTARTPHKYYRNILTKDSYGNVDVSAFKTVRGLGNNKHSYFLKGSERPRQSQVPLSSFIADFGSDEDLLYLGNNQETLYPEGLQDGKVGFARLGDDLFIDLNKNGTIEMIDEDYSDAPQDLIVIDFFGKGRIETIKNGSSIDVGDWVYNNLTQNSIESICTPAESEPEPESEAEAKPELKGVSGRVFGDPHLLTFDRRRLSFQGVGEFIQAKTLDGSFEVQGRYKQIGSSASLPSAVAAKLGRDRVGIYAGQNPPLRVNGKPVRVDDGLLVLDGGSQIYRDRSTYTIISPTGEGLKVRTSFAGGGSVFFDIIVPKTRRGQVTGLLGNFNADSFDDIQTRSGTVLPSNPNYEQLYKVFGNSWRISQEESLLDYGPGETTATFTDFNFPSKIVRTNDFPGNLRAAAERTCREAGVTDPELLEACIFDILVTQDERFAQVSANVQEELTSSIIDSSFPFVVDTTPAEDSTVKNVSSITIGFSEALNTSLLNLSGLELIYLGADGTLGGSDDRIVSLASIEVPSENRFTVFVDGSLKRGNYQLTVAPSIVADNAGNSLVERYTLNFRVETLGTGDIQATLRWASNDDLDLIVIDPKGEELFHQNKQVSSGGRLDVDANANCRNTTTYPVENIFWPPAKAPAGDYIVGVHLFKRCQNSQNPIPFNLAIKIEGETQTFNNALDESNKFFTVLKTLQGSGSAEIPRTESSTGGVSTFVYNTTELDQPGLYLSTATLLYNDGDILRGDFRVYCPTSTIRPTNYVLLDKYGNIKQQGEWWEPAFQPEYLPERVLVDRVCNSN